MYPKWFLYDKVHKIGIQQVPLESSLDANTDAPAGPFATEPWNRQGDIPQHTSGNVSVSLFCASQLFPCYLVHTECTQMAFERINMSFNTSSLWVWVVKAMEWWKRKNILNIKLLRKRFLNFQLTYSFFSECPIIYDRPQFFPQSSCSTDNGDNKPPF